MSPAVQQFNMPKAKLLHNRGIVGQDFNFLTSGQTTGSTSENAVYYTASSLLQ